MAKSRTRSVRCSTKKTAWSARFETHDTLTLGEFRDALGTSRDHALLVLEYYDRRGILRREGDVRRPGAQFGEIEK